MTPNRFISTIESYWKEKLSPDNVRIYHQAVARFKPDHLRQIAEDVVEFCVFFPKVRDILKLSERLMIDENLEATNRGCKLCDGTCWVSVTLKHPRTGRPYEAVTSCSCTSRKPPPAKAKRPKSKKRGPTLVAKFATDVYPD